ncbi:hypothetical protein MLD38_023229 [Melastoma candidum]|uniref:Uncharacterized protein n=1 Tax=Melastoma candidum TaxID=119954 RepID=A0ACB9QLU9_9MYRT|nr:hypothetical protein MLD38_023229 [Melastoma candidum]
MLGSGGRVVWETKGCVVVGTGRVGIDPPVGRVGIEPPVGREEGRGGRVTFGTARVGMPGSGGRVVWGTEGWVVVVGTGRLGIDPPVGRLGIDPPFGRVGRDGIGGNPVGMGRFGIVGTVVACKRWRAPRLTSTLDNNTTAETTNLQIMENFIL